MLFFILKKLFVVFNDERPVRQLRGAEDDRRGRSGSASHAYAEDKAPRACPAQVHVRQAHSGQAREVFYEE